MKEKILDATAELILQYGLKKFTVDEIATKLQISKKTIYKYFKSKEDIIREYFDVVIKSDKDGILSILSGNDDWNKKMHAIVYSNHQYRLTIFMQMEAKQFYPEIWSKIEDLKQFKMNAVNSLIQEGINSGVFKPNIHYAVLLKMLEKISDMFIDYDFLLENHINTREALDEALKIIFEGILKEN